MKQKFIVSMTSLVITFVLLFFTPPLKANPNSASRTPVVYSYWAGWSDVSIPNFKFDGLFMAFAMMRSSAPGAYYTDYALSGNFQNWSNTGPFNKWNSWWLSYWNTGARAYVSYGGGTNDEFRRMIINADDSQLDKIAGEIKANIAKYSYDGVDLDIESWWLHTRAENEKFALQLAKLVKILRKSLDNDPATLKKPIMLAVGITSAYSKPITDQYSGTMNQFYTDKEAMNAISDINIMSYNSGVPDFYSKIELIDDYLSHYKVLGVPENKLILGVQICESNGFPPTSLDVVKKLAEHSKQKNYGGLFLWGIGAYEVCGQNPADYIKAMQSGLGIN